MNLIEVSFRREILDLAGTSSTLITAHYLLIPSINFRISSREESLSCRNLQQLTSICEKNASFSFDDPILIVKVSLAYNFSWQTPPVFNLFCLNELKQ